MRYLRWIMAHLGGPGAWHAVIVVALVLALPSLFSGFFIDEYVQAARWRAALDLAGAVSIGRFLRPLSALADATRRVPCAVRLG
jgi:hypothetical protein